MRQHFEKWERLVRWRPVIEGELEPGVVFHRELREKKTWKEIINLKRMKNVEEFNKVSALSGENQM